MSISRLSSLLLPLPLLERDLLREDEREAGPPP
jgi:hypothetical protein